MKKMKTYLLLFACSIAFFFNSNESKAQERITKYLKYGKYNIGYKVFHLYDDTRSYFPKNDYYGKRTNSKLGRPMQVSLWYPTFDNDPSKKIDYKKYIEFTSSEVLFYKNDAKSQKKAVENIYRFVKKENIDGLNKLLNESINVYFNAKEIDSDFPVILYSPPQDTSSSDNSIICEYLASKGYLVISSMAKGEYTNSQKHSVRSVHVQAEDLAFLYSFSKKLTKSDKVGTFGFSRGGIANIIFAMKNKNIDATVSLDGSILSQGWLNDIKKSIYYNPTDFNSNLLIITKNLKNPQLNPSTFYDNVKFTDKAFIRYDHAEHGYFSGLNLMYSLVMNNKLSNLEKENIYKFYAEMASYVSEFFDDKIKNNTKFKEHNLKLFKHSYEYKKGKRQPLEPNSIYQLILNEGIDKVNAILKDILKAQPDYLQKLRWRDLDRVSTELTSENRIDEAIKTLQLSNKIFPKWYITNYNLAELYIRIDKKDIAIAHYKEALLDNPKHVNSIKALNELKVNFKDYHIQKINNLTPYLGTYRVDKKRYRKLYIEDNELYLYSNYWDKPLKIWPYSKELFLIEESEAKNNMQILFQFDKKGKVISLKTRGLNSGKIGEPNLKE